jgi:hypothetical protein
MDHGASRLINTSNETWRCLSGHHFFSARFDSKDRPPVGLLQFRAGRRPSCFAASRFGNPRVLKLFDMASLPKAPWRISADDTAELFSQFGSLGIRVPRRTEAKDQFAEEIYCLRRYLFPLADNNLLRFPIAVAKTESPDFIFSWEHDTIVGVEVTKATRKEFEADLTRLNRKQKTKHYPSDPDEGVMDLSIAGWAGNALERELVEYVLAAVADKLEDIDTYSVGPCDLLIYDNTPTGAPDLTLVAETLHLKLSANSLCSNSGRSFGVISVIRDPWLIYDIGGTYKTLDYKPEWGVP